MNQLAKAQLQQVQNPRQVNAMEGVNMLANKRRQRGQQNQWSPDQFDNDCGGFQNDGYDGQNEEEVRIDIQDAEVETQNDVNPSREHLIDMLEMVVPKAKTPLPRPLPPYPQRLAKHKNENHFKKFIDMMKRLSINMPLVEALEQMPGYAKFMKDLVTKKRSMDCETIKMTHQVSAIVHSMDPKLNDPGAFTIPCTIGSADFAKALCDLGATDFVILDYEVDYEVSIILGRPFIATGKVLVDVEAGELTFQVGDEKVDFHVCKSMKQPNSSKVCSFVDLVMAVIVDDTSAMINVEDPLEAVLLNLDVDTTLAVLQKWKKAIGWILSDIRRISPAFCMHKIILEDDAKPSLEQLRRLNEEMQEVAKKEVIKWLDAGVVYPISNSSWTSPVQCVPKKGGMTVVANLQNELIPTRTVIGWRDAFWVVQCTGYIQRCMMAFFTDMVEDILEVFMDNFSVVGDSFDECLKNFDRVLSRCEEINLVLNWEKCHFIVEEGIFLGQQISKHGFAFGLTGYEML
ncbi:uncharacterized protein [Nicotiana sylvestris]|uniref:uncharacterized protein n=1 Tax=Nicotiana sylvestris TaxID=4096 RepID=UPI00388C52F7